MPPRGGRLSAAGGGRRQFDVDIRIEGVDRSSDEFRQARREFNVRIRNVMQTVGKGVVLPDIRGEMPARWSDTLFVQRERSGVFIGSKLRGALNRALGWWDFGGKRPLDTQRRTGAKTLVRSLDHHRDRIDDAVLRGLMDAFDPIEHTP